MRQKFYRSSKVSAGNESLSRPFAVTRTLGSYDFCFNTRNQENTIQNKSIYVWFVLFIKVIQRQIVEFAHYTALIFPTENEVTPEQKTS